jgi:hypothetical protein
MFKEIRAVFVWLYIKRIQSGAIRIEGGRRCGCQTATMDAGEILRKIDFNYTRNDFGVGKIDLV